MPIYRQNERGQFVPFEAGKPELEKQLEEWIEQSPHLLLEGQPLAVIGRQSTTSFGKSLDLLAVDKTGATVVIELKRALPPRDIIAQALEYTAWIDSLSLDDLDAVARDYAEKKLGLQVEGVADIYDAAFGGQEIEGSDVVDDPDDEEDADGQSPSANITFNARQRIVIVAESFPGEMEQTLRYLRGRLGVDISAVRFQVHQLSNETLLETNVVVGREGVGVSKITSGEKTAMPHDAIRNKVSTPFLEGQVEGLEDWIDGLAPGIAIQHNKGTRHSIYMNGQHVGGYYFAINWIRFWLNGRVDGDTEDLQGLNDQASVTLKKNQIVGNVVDEHDLEVYRRRLKLRVAPSGVVDSAT